MGACGAGFGSLDPAFAARVELELVYAELRGRLAVPPSREVFCEEHRRECDRLGRRIPYREILERLAR
jgi:hypothetical protein